MTTGYGHILYADSLAEFGQPRFLPHCEGWILERGIPHSPDRDGMGCYPLFACRAWSSLANDLADLENRLVSLVLVTDPYAPVDLVQLSAWFNRGVVPFKEHFIHDLSRPIEESVSPHHRRNARKALAKFHVEPIPAIEYLEHWQRLYACLVRRHGIQGIQAFSDESFAKQLATPGMVAFRAVRGDITAGMLLWYMMGDVGYYHLGAFDDTGYEEGAAFALFWSSLTYFAPMLRWLCLGAAAGLREDPQSGLARFKRGWATGSRTAYLCKHVSDPVRYALLTKNCGDEESYFPAYRQGKDSNVQNGLERLSHA